jgi:hypothetical protein
VGAIGGGKLYRRRSSALNGHPWELLEAIYTGEGPAIFLKKKTGDGKMKLGH